MGKLSPGGNHADCIPGGQSGHGPGGTSLYRQLRNEKAAAVNIPPQPIFCAKSSLPPYLQEPDTQPILSSYPDFAPHWPAAPPSQGSPPMTGFRHVQPPLRLQWRYRSGFAPDSLFSHGARTAPRTLRWLFTFPINIAHFQFLVNQKSGINPLSAASASWTKPSRSLRYIQLSTASYSSSVIRRS